MKKAIIVLGVLLVLCIFGSAAVLPYERDGSSEGGGGVCDPVPEEMIEPVYVPVVPVDPVAVRVLVQGVSTKKTWVFVKEVGCTHWYVYKTYQVGKQGRYNEKVYDGKEYPARYKKVNVCRM